MGKVRKDIGSLGRRAAHRRDGAPQVVLHAYIRSRKFSVRHIPASISNPFCLQRTNLKLSATSLMSDALPTVSNSQNTPCGMCYFVWVVPYVRLLRNFVVCGKACVLKKCDDDATRIQ